jgi:Carboxypeptidase regulatory-like domain/TonB dependent receptor
MSRTCQVAFSSFLAAAFAFAQIPTGTILGVVTDPSGAAVPEANITITNALTGTTRTLQTGSDGAYRANALAVGAYSIRVSHDGFKTTDLPGMALAVSQEAVVNVALQVGTAQQTVEVTAAAEEVNTTNATLGTLVNEQKVQDLPLNGRSFIDLTLLQPGVQQGNPSASGGTYFSVNGAPIRSNAILLDGATMTTGYGAQTTAVGGANLGIDGILEYRVITNSFGPEYGMFMGSVTTIVTKGGTNQFHGDVFDYFRNSVLDARNFFDPPSTIIGRRIPLYQRNQFGGAFGGPVKKDKTFFYAVYEQLKDNLNSPEISSVLPAACHTANGIVSNQACLGLPAPGTTTVNPVVEPLLALFPNPNLPGVANNYTFSQRINTNEYYGQMRFDQVISPKDSFFARFTSDNETKPFPVSYPSVDINWDTVNNFSTISESHVFSPTVVNQAHASYSHTDIRFTDSTDEKGPGLSFGNPNVPVGNVIVTGLTTYDTSVVPMWNKQNVYTLGDDISWTNGRHALKFGALFNRYDNPQQSNFFENGIAVFANPFFFLQGLPLTYQISTVDPGIAQNRNYRYYTAGFYAGDDYRVNSRLTLNLGLRYEFFTVPTELNHRSFSLRDIVNGAPVLCTTPAPTCVTQGPEFRNPSLLDFSPRFGFAWDVTGKGTTSIRGGGGIFYDIGSIQNVYIWSSLGTPPIAGVNSVGPCIPFCASPALTLPLTIPPGSASSSVETANYYIKQPTLYQWNLSVEHKLPGSVVLTVAYVGTRGVHLWQAKEANPVLPTSVVGGIPYWDPAVLGPEENAGCLSIVPTCRRDPNLGSNIQVNSLGESFYNALQIGVNKRLSHGFQIQGSYVWSKSLDDSNGIVADGSGTMSGEITEALYTKRIDWGPSPFDVKNNLRINLLYRVPNLQSSNPIAQVAKGWWLGSIVAAQSGFPFSPTLSYDPSLSGLEEDRASPVTAGNLAQALAFNPNAVLYNKNTVIVGSPTEWYNPNMFTVPPNGSHGTLGRNAFRGPGLYDWDLSMNKDTPIRKLGEGANLQFRAEFFNLLNHPNFQVPQVAGLGATEASSQGINPIAGSMVATTTTSRQIQLALKLIF